MKLLTASMDKTMIIWAPDEDDAGVWVEQVSTLQKTLCNFNHFLVLIICTLKDLFQMILF